jgi:redox-sensitive bicupin YhaK (pirin superfamily)
MENTTIDLRRAGERFHTDAGWLDSWHSFSFGPHYSADNVGHGLLIVSNDDRVAPGMGFGMHPHRDMEIVTWVLAGQLEHRDSEGNHGMLYPGLAQRMSAGTGIRHSEMNGSPDAEVHFVQMWVLPDEQSISPGYEQLDVNALLDAGGLVPVATGRGSDAAIAIHQRHATMWVGRLAPGASAELPDDPFVHAFVALGSAHLEDAATLAQGDAARLTNAGARRITAGDAGAEVIVWGTA